MSKNLFQQVLLIIISGIFLTNCDFNNGEQVEVENENLPLPLSSKKKPEIEPGSYCFETRKNTEQNITAQILIAYDYSVTGIIESFKKTQNKQLNNELEYKEFIAGELKENQLEVTINRDKDPENKSRIETWSLNSKNLTTSQDIYEQINCETLIKPLK